LDHNSPIYASPSSWDDRCVPLFAAIGWDGVSGTPHPQSLFPPTPPSLEPWSSCSLPLK
jgi:hypothetical protein